MYLKSKLSKPLCILGGSLYPQLIVEQADFFIRSSHNAWGVWAIQTQADLVSRNWLWSRTCSACFPSLLRNLPWLPAHCSPWPSPSVNVSIQSHSFIPAGSHYGPAWGAYVLSMQTENEHESNQINKITACCDQLVKETNKRDRARINYFPCGGAIWAETERMKRRCGCDMWGQKEPRGEEQRVQRPWSKNSLV